MKEKPVLAIIAPCYNEEEVLPTTINVLSELLDKMIADELISEASYLYFVDDGSKDRTWEIISEHHNKTGRVKGLKLAGNVGHQKALWAGMDRCADQCDCLVTIDADLQDDETKIIDMVKLFHKGYDIVYGVRNDRSTDSFLKRFLAEMFYKIFLSMGVKAIFNHADFRLMSQRAVKALMRFQERNIFIRGMVPAMGFKTTQVYYKRKTRLAGEPKYSFKTLSALAWDGITSFSILPLRIITYLGFIAFFISIIMSLFVFYAVFFTDKAVPGWASTLISIYFLGGVQLLSLGILGEYIGKIYKEVKHRPHYLIDKELT